jgi:hypothetical protein
LKQPWQVLGVVELLSVICFIIQGVNCARINLEFQNIFKGFVLKGSPPLFEEFVKLNKRDITIWYSQNENLPPLRPVQRLEKTLYTQAV